ncbi:SDR family NAD(P)-dependent oxidoreductase [Pontibacter sp. G13]|uniref:SDR family NAD(P)-dependent oxidoreductase n=1 Tax=Pontibacter sp. G13 TaxID=3074898 RepID=UPI0028894B91|nr:SDR family NAD(P)-dependent oxidoreductase [Pontibacter sp. G13]WNJ20108.1 SDR family NAD(P)-dependent oxidoreductase [Pontibacter sp. G13]
MSTTPSLILITGGSSGIGKAAAIEFGRLGAEIIIQARNPQKLADAADEIRQTGAKVHTYSTDLTDPDEAHAAAKQIMAEVGVPDLIINSAGAGEWLSLSEANPQHYRDTMASPYLATAHTCHAFFEAMRKRGSGQMIIVNSAACYFNFPGATGYIPARWAMLGLAKALQADTYGMPVDISIAIFGKVSSPYFANNPISEQRIPKIVSALVKTMSEEDCGKVLVKMSKSRRKTVVKPPMMALFAYVNRFFPNLFNWLLRVTGENGNLSQQETTASGVSS